MKDTLPTIFVLFGATGDLARRKLIPALWQLYMEKRLPTFFQVVGVARQKLSDTEWRDKVRSIVEESAQDNREQIESFIGMFTYTSGLFEDTATYERIADSLGKKDGEWKTCANKLFHLAVPPQLYDNILRKLSDSGLTEPCSEDEGWTRVIVEKPFGKDLATAQELDELLGKLFQEEQIYRIDHYLGKDTVRNILAWRFSNAFLEPAWNSKFIDHIHIKILESGGVDGRGAFYDGIGALRDMGQNHLLQLLTLFTMENPGAFDAESIRRERTKVLEALEVMDSQDVARHTVRGQYAGYKDVDGVANDSERETYFRVQAHLHSTRWRGVPIYLESGKGLTDRLAEVEVKFRHQTPCLCPATEHYTNTLRYRIQPHEGMFMSFWVKRPGTEMVIEEKDFSFDYEQAYGDDQFIDAYAKLLNDAIQGDQTLFVSTSEIVRSWQFIDPIEKGWQKGDVPLNSYEIGSEGPAWPPVSRESSLPEKQIGYIGLGKMGFNMVERLLEHEWGVVASDPAEEARNKAQGAGAVVAETAADVVKSLKSPRLVWLMVPHLVVDTVLEEILPHLGAGDTVVDGGNSNYKESVRRGKDVEKNGIKYLDVGVSGGPSGARDGACLMVGGDRDVYKNYAGLFSDLATAAGYDYMGESGAGHFVKMVHNGIEYGMMQAIGEGFEVMEKAKHELDLERIARLYNHGSVIESSLIGWLKDAYEKYGQDLNDISGSVKHSGEGQWTVEVAKKLGIPVPIIEGALQFRVDSEDGPSYTGQVVSALRNMFGGHDVKKG